MKVAGHKKGSFCWAELMTSDSAGAKAFYSALLGVEFTDNPVSPDMVYSMVSKDGENVAGMFELHAENMPPCWGAYICVDSADETAAKILDAGGSLIEQPFDVMNFGRSAVAKDPTGAVFMLWEPKQHPGYTLINEPGSVCWNELRTSDTDKAGAFYASVFGYALEHSNMPMPYTQFTLDGKSLGGMSAIGADEVHIPPHWMVIFTVAECEASLEVVKANGGTVLVGPFDVPGVGTFAVIQDPQGAVVGIVD